MPTLGLDEALSPGDIGHVAAHDIIHDKVNPLFDDWTVVGTKQGNLSARPTDLDTDNIGFQWWNIDIRRLDRWNGTSWDEDVPEISIGRQTMAVFDPAVTVTRVVDTDIPTDGLTWTANPSIVWWEDRFWLVFDGNNTGGTQEGQAGQTIWMKTSTDGVTWAPAIKPFHDGAHATNPITDVAIGFQPCLVIVGDELWCYWTQGSNVYVSKLADPNGAWTNNRFEFLNRQVFLSSTVNGAASGGHSLFLSFGGHSDWFPFSPTDPVVLSDGVVAFPTTLRSSFPDPDVQPGTPAGFFTDLKYNAVIFHDPVADTWTLSDDVPPGTFPPSSAWEPTVWEAATGELYLYSRNNQTALPDKDALLVARSVDRQTWTTEESTELVVAVSRPSVKRIADSRWLMTHNDYPQGDTGSTSTFSVSGRQNGSLFASRRGVDDFTPGISFSGDTAGQSYPQFCVHNDKVYVAFNETPSSGRHTTLAVLDAPIDESVAYVYPRQRSELDQAGPVFVNDTVDHWAFNGHAQATEASAAPASADWTVAAWVESGLTTGVVLDARIGAGEYSFVFTLDRIALNSLNVFLSGIDTSRPGLYSAAMDSANSKLILRYAAANDAAFTTVESVLRCLLFGSNPSDADTVTVNGTVFTFKNAPAAGTDVQIGATAAATAGSLATKLVANGFVASTQDNGLRVFVARSNGATFTVSSGTAAVTTPALSTINMTPAAARVGYKNLVGSSLTGLFGDVYEVRQFASLLTDNNLRYLFNQLAPSLGGSAMGGTATNPGAPDKLFDAASTSADFPDLDTEAPFAEKSSGRLVLHGEASGSIELPYESSAVALRFKFSANPTGGERWVIATFGTAAHNKQLYVDGATPTDVLLDGAVVASVADLTADYTVLPVIVSGQLVKIGAVAVSTGAHGGARLFLGSAHTRPGLLGVDKTIAFDALNMTVADAATLLAGPGDLEAAGLTANYVGTATTSDLVTTKVTGDAFIRSALRADGSQSQGDGTSAPAQAMRAGNTNTLLGRGALAVVTGSNNTGIGRAALGALTTGGQNTAVGYEAMKNQVTHNNATALGFQAGRDADAHDNVFIGYYSGYGPNSNTANKTTTGTRNVFVGKETGQASTTQRNDGTAVGNRALVDADNATALGSGAEALHASSVALGKDSVTTAASQVMVGARDVEITDTAKGVVLKSPDGTRYRIQVANGGGLSTVGA